MVCAFFRMNSSISAAGASAAGKGRMPTGSKCCCMAGCVMMGRARR